MVKKTKYQTSRVHWRLGQALLPEHFYAQEHSLREEMSLHWQMSPWPMSGLGTLEWDHFQLADGIVSIKEMTLILSTGHLIDIPGNTRPVSFNLNATGLSECSVYLHLESDFEVVRTGSGSDLPDESVERVVQKVSVSTKPHRDTAVHSFRLCDFAKGAEGHWNLEADYLPALIRMVATPLTAGLLERITAIAGRYHQQLVEDIQQNYLAGQAVQAAKACMKGLFKLRAALNHLEAGVDCHPAQFFQVFQEFYFDVCVYKDQEPRKLNLLYAHDAPADSFIGLMEELEGLLTSSTSDTAYVPFQPQDGMVVCEVPDAVRKAREVYLLLQKESIGEDVDLEGLKLASKSRVEVVHRLSLGGIPVQRIEKPPFHHDFGSEIEFYQLLPGEEWDHALRDGTVAYFDRTQLQSCRSYLYWREEN